MNKFGEGQSEYTSLGYGGDIGSKLPPTMVGKLSLKCVLCPGHESGWGFLLSGSLSYLAGFHTRQAKAR